PQPPTQPPNPRTHTTPTGGSHQRSPCTHLYGETYARWGRTVQAGCGSAAARGSARCGAGDRRGRGVGGPGGVGGLDPVAVGRGRTVRGGAARCATTLGRHGHRN